MIFLILGLPKAQLPLLRKSKFHDLPSLENKLYRLANNVIDLEIKKKESNSQLFDLGQTITQYQNIIDNKKQQLMKMDTELAIHHGKSKLDRVSEVR